jgi:hypothetical protein
MKANLGCGLHQLGENQRIKRISSKAILPIPASSAEVVGRFWFRESS